MYSKKNIFIGILILLVNFLGGLYMFFLFQKGEPVETSIDPGKFITDKNINIKIPEIENAGNIISGKREVAVLGILRSKAYGLIVVTDGKGKDILITTDDKTIFSLLPVSLDGSSGSFSYEQIQPGDSVEVTYIDAGGNKGFYAQTVQVKK